MHPKLLIVGGSSLLVLTTAILIAAANRDHVSQQSAPLQRSSDASRIQESNEPLSLRPSSSRPTKSSERFGSGTTRNPSSRSSHITRNATGNPISKPSRSSRERSSLSGNRGKSAPLPAAGSEHQTIHPVATPPPSPDVLHFDGLRIEVHGFGTPEKGGDLLISVVPESEATVAPASSPTGFTLQEELFRAKWGWTAYDQVKRVAREHTEQTIR